MLAADDWLFSTTWVHVFEEDTAQGAVYRPEEGSVPLSRRPRERFALTRDGLGHVFAPGPDDRFVEQPVTWTMEGDEVIVRPRGAGAPFRVVERSPQRLLVTRATPKR
jgi:hypothetical protein